MSGNKYIITQGVTTSMEKNRIRPIPTGKSMRMSYQRQKEVLEMPNLIEVQKDSYNWFLEEGLKEVFADISPITDYSGKLSLEFVDFTLCEDDVKYSIEECKERDATYAAPLKVKVRLYNKENDEIKEHEIFMGDLPLMTLAERAYIASSKALLSQNDPMRIKEFLPKLDWLMNNYKEMTYPGYFYGKLLLALGSNRDDALKAIIPFATSRTSTKSYPPVMLTGGIPCR